MFRCEQSRQSKISFLFRTVEAKSTASARKLEAREISTPGLLWVKRIGTNSRLFPGLKPLTHQTMYTHLFDDNKVFFLNESLFN